MSTTTHQIPESEFADFADDMEQAGRLRHDAAALSAQADGIQNNAARRLLRKMGIPGGPNVRINGDTKEVEVDGPDAVVPAGPEA